MLKRNISYIIVVLFYFFAGIVCLFSQETSRKPGLSISRNDNSSHLRVSVNIDNGRYILGTDNVLTLELTPGQHFMFISGSGTGYRDSEQVTFTINDDIHVYTVTLATSHTGNIILLNKTGIVSLKNNNDTNVIQNSFRTLSQNIPNGAKIAFVNIESNDKEEGEFFLEEISMAFVNSRNFVVVERRTLDVILMENHFQMTGYVDDDSIVSIGHFIGADVVLTGSISGTGNRKRLRIRALDVKTARILAQSSESL